MNVLETKTEAEESAQLIMHAKDELTAAQEALQSGRESRNEEISRLRAELEGAIRDDQMAPADQPEPPKRAKSGDIDGVGVKNLLQPLRLASEANMSKATWQDLWPTLTNPLQKSLWNRGLAQLYYVILATLDETQKSLITAANANDQLDGWHAYCILRTHTYGSKDEWISRLWHNVQNWSQDRGAQRELGRPRKLLEALMILETDCADYERTGEKISERTRLIVLKKGLAKRQRPALEKIKDDLSGEEWGYEKTVNWLLTWDRAHQDEIKKGEAEASSAWRSSRNSSRGNGKAAANAARATQPNRNATGKSGPGQKKRGACNICGKMGHWAAQCPNKGKSGRATANVVNPKQKNGRGPPRPAGRGGGRSTFKCWNCGKDDHYARDCPLPPQPKKCFNCGSKDHLQADCPKRKVGGGGNASKAASAQTMSVSRDQLKTLVRYANSHKSSPTITLSLDASTGNIGACASDKPMPTSLVLIPMPTDPDEAQHVANIVSAHSATRPVMDTGASMSTVPEWYELTDEHDTNVNIMCAGDGLQMKSTREGTDGELGNALKVPTSTPLCAIRPLDEKGVTTVFHRLKVMAFTSQEMEAILDRAVEEKLGVVVGHAKPGWVYELTDRRALERVVRAATNGTKLITSVRASGRQLPADRDAAFADLGFDPSVQRDESRAERERQWRNEKRRHMGPAQADASEDSVDQLESTTDYEEVLSNSQSGSDTTDGPAGNDDEQKCEGCGATGYDPMNVVKPCAWCNFGAPEATPAHAAIHEADKPPPAPKLNRDRNMISDWTVNLGVAFADADENDDIDSVMDSNFGTPSSHKWLAEFISDSDGQPLRLEDLPTPQEKEALVDADASLEDFSVVAAHAASVATADKTQRRRRPPRPKVTCDTCHNVYRTSGSDTCPVCPKGESAGAARGTKEAAPADGRQNRRTCRCNGCDKPQFWDTMRKRFSRHCSLRCMQGRCGHQKSDTRGAPTCVCNGCSKNCHYDALDKSYSEHCSLRCRSGRCGHGRGQEQAKAPVLDPAPVCACDGCERSCHHDGKAFAKYCGTTCRDGKCAARGRRCGRKQSTGDCQAASARGAPATAKASTPNRHGDHEHQSRTFDLTQAAVEELMGPTGQVKKEIEDGNSVRISVEPRRGASKRAVRVSGQAKCVEAACSQMEGVLCDFPGAIASLQRTKQRPKTQDQDVGHPIGAAILDMKNLRRQDKHVLTRDKGSDLLTAYKMACACLKRACDEDDQDEIARLKTATRHAHKRLIKYLKGRKASHKRKAGRQHVPERKLKRREPPWRKGDGALNKAMRACEITSKAGRSPKTQGHSKATLTSKLSLAVRTAALLLLRQSKGHISNDQLHKEVMMITQSKFTRESSGTDQSEIKDALKDLHKQIDLTRRRFDSLRKTKESAAGATKPGPLPKTHRDLIGEVLKKKHGDMVKRMQGIKDPKPKPDHA